MKVTGEIGHFLADHVTAQIDTIDHLREKVQSGKARVSKFPISGPTDVSHDYHWGRDGKKWFANEVQNHDIAGYVLCDSLFLHGGGGGGSCKWN